MREKEKDKIRILRCESIGCRKKLSPGRWPVGWSQCGKSRFHKKYDPDGIASWCPEHEIGGGISE